jgi:hypothetical protein
MTLLSHVYGRSPYLKSQVIKYKLLIVMVPMMRDMHIETSLWNLLKRKEL